MRGMKVNQLRSDREREKYKEKKKNGRKENGGERERKGGMSNLEKETHN